MGGHWKSTNPKAEQLAMENKNQNSNGLLYDTCKHFRFIRDKYFKSYHLSGIVIDSFVYHAIQSWKWSSPGEVPAPQGSYESALRGYLQWIKSSRAQFLTAPGSGMRVNISEDLNILEKVVDLIAP